MKVMKQFDLEQFAIGIQFVMSYYLRIYFGPWTFTWLFEVVEPEPQRRNEGEK